MGLRGPTRAQVSVSGSIPAQVGASSTAPSVGGDSVPVPSAVVSPSSNGPYGIGELLP